MKNIFEYVGKYMTKWLVVATLVGIGGGLSAVALKYSIEYVTSIGNYFPLWLAPIIGGTLVSIIYLKDKNAAGFGTDLYLAEVNGKNKVLKFPTLFSKLIATAITIGFKGSGGVEGPMLVMGSSLGDGVSRIPFIKNFFNDEDKRRLAICGAAGAVGAIFRSPLGGGIFVVEVLYRTTLNYGDLFPAMLSSTIGFVIYSMISTSLPLFTIPDYLPNVYNLPLFVLAGIMAGIFALIFMAVFKRIQGVFKTLPYKQIHPIFGGIITGLIIYLVPRAAGAGNSVIQEMINQSFPILILLALLVGKILATSFSVGSGGSAGLVIPALFIGALAGNTVSSLIGNLDPGLGSSLVIAGMAASLAGIANVPIAASIMLVEMVGLKLGVPATIGSIMGYAIAHSQIIYGVTSPREGSFLNVEKWRQSDVNKGH
ncbi:CIC family chloride channel protein [Natranaerovirga pectinivora]|uniref:CIC family chloride channel protein n=1 Tax=Natranaerovirga pectinivora TaxID=682400 RepID=A0A4R3MR11_9FIRM|nr:chloride channel protein [Natranaerovirga pectinivora]TCT16366.1 CIC family chloride channel protein [Natranaerovirga pectinivora]